MTRQQQVIQVLRPERGASLHGICRAVGVDPGKAVHRGQVRSVLQALERKGLARRDGLGLWYGAHPVGPDEWDMVGRYGPTDGN